MDSILTSIKKLLGIDSSYTAFDQDLIMYINSAFNVLQQIGIGPHHGFSITGDKETWDQFYENGAENPLVRTYIHKKVRLQWDPPTIASVLEALKASIAEDEWRLSVMAPVMEDIDE